MSGWKTVAASSILVCGFARGACAQVNDLFDLAFIGDPVEAQTISMGSESRTASQALNAQYLQGPRSVRVYRSPLPPKREIGIHVAGWAFAGAGVGELPEPCCDESGGTSDVGVGGVSYTRSLSETVAVEAGFDTGQGRRGHQFSALTARLIARPRRSDLFLSLGVADAIAGRGARYYPRGMGFIVGGGMQPRLSNHLSLRAQLDLLRFSPEVSGVRFGVGAFVGFD
jgi:hypothetical protein